MATPKFEIEEIAVRGLLSFGPDAQPLRLAPLNVLIGPNASGKSNLISAIDLLRHLPHDWRRFISERGGLNEWIWKGYEANPALIRRGSVEVQTLEESVGPTRIRHTFETNPSARSGKAREQIVQLPRAGAEERVLFDAGGLIGEILTDNGVRRIEDRMDGVDLGDSALAQFADPLAQPDLRLLADRYERIQIYREWAAGPSTPARKPQPADLPRETLLESGQNLAHVVDRLTQSKQLKRRILDELRQVCGVFEDLRVDTSGGLLSLQLYESAFDKPISASRLSEGTLRWLMLLCVLLDPTPPPLICIEEPENGLHPDLITGVARLLEEASERTQLVVTTHSALLIDSLSHRPEAVIVCERQDGKSTLRRLAAADLAAWHEKYTLGELWSSGRIGGNRW